MNGNSPYFSIVVISLNAEKYIEGTINSVLMQDFDDYEIIVKDGLSSDKTLECVPQSDKIKVFCEKDSGIYQAMNQATEKCTGKYICYLNCGDLFYNSTVLGTVYEFTKNLDSLENIVYSNIMRDGIMKRHPHKFTGFKMYKNSICHQSAFFGRTVFEKHGYYNENMKIMSDYEYFVMSYKQNVPLLYCDFISSVYLPDGISESSKNKKIKKNELIQVYRKYFSFWERAAYNFLIFLSMRWLRVLISDDSSPAFIRNTYKKTANFLNR